LECSSTNTDSKEALANVIYSVIPAEAGIQKYLIILDFGLRFALYTMRCRASLARNDDGAPVFEFCKNLNG